MKLLIGFLTLHFLCSVTLAGDFKTVTVTGEITAVDSEKAEVIISLVSDMFSETGEVQRPGSVLLVQLTNAPFSDQLIDAFNVNQPDCNLKGKRVQFSGHYLDDQTFLADSVSTIAHAKRFRDKTGVRSRLNKRNGRCGFQ